MVGDAGMSPGAVVGGGGGVSRIDLTGYATESWVNENYLSIEFFSSLFKAYDSANTPNEIVPNGGDTSAITNIKAMFGFWTEQYLSALGQNSGGGGGLSLNEPLASINAAGLGTPSQANVGIIWNGTAWVYGSTGGGGGTVMQVNTGTGLTGGPISGTGTISINSTYQSYISHGETAYGWGNHANAGYLTSVAFSDLTSHPSTLSGYGITDAKFGTAGTDYVPITLGSTTKNVLTSHQTITDTMINTALGFTLTGTAGTTYNLQGIANYAVDGETAYNWGDHAQAGYMAGSTTFWGQSVSNGAVSGSIEAGNSGGALTGFHGIELNTHGSLSGYGGFIDFHYDGSQSDYTVRLIEESAGVLRIYGALRIGNAILSWDSSSNCLKITGSMYATGGVSALG